MLLLSCGPGQKVAVGRAGVTVTVLEVRGDRVRLAVSTPAGCAVHPQKVWQEFRPPGPSEGGGASPAG